MREQQLTMVYEERIRTGWEQVSAKYPQLAGREYFQDAVLAAYAKNPTIPLAAHADAMVKDVFEPWKAFKDAEAQKERDNRREVSRRVVPGGRGAAGGQGGKSEEKKSVGEKIRDAFKARNETE